MPGNVENQWGLTVQEIPRDSELEQMLISKIPDNEGLPLLVSALLQESVEVDEIPGAEYPVPVAEFQSSV